MKEHIKLILISIPLALALFYIHGLLLSQSWGFSIASILETKNKILIYSLLFTEYLLTSLVVAIPYAFIVTSIVKMRPFNISLFSLLYLLVIYIIGFVMESFIVNESISGIFNRIIILLCITIFFSVYLIAHQKQKNA